MPDNELFYAGYWLAKSGQYEQALGYLTKAQQKDERILTYMGYATRKLGDVEAALPLYMKALSLNPNYSVARAYMGEAFLTKGQPDKAKAELAEIAQRCGTTCAPVCRSQGTHRGLRGRAARLIASSIYWILFEPRLERPRFLVCGGVQDGVGPNAHARHRHRPRRGARHRVRTSRKLTAPVWPVIVRRVRPRERSQMRSWPSAPPDAMCCALTARRQDR